MKLTSKFPIAIFVAALVVANITGCAKKENLTAAKTTPVVPAEVYDVKNTAAIYPTTGMTADASGNVYVVDYVNNIIKKFTPAGVVTIIAGNGHIGSADGIGTAASFNYSEGLAIDAANNLYVADSGNNMIRKISPAGVVTTIAGNGNIGSADGMGSLATFNFPQGIAVDNAGNIYVSDTGNDLIRKITTDGMVTTLAGRVAPGKANGIGAEATFNIPEGLTMDPKGNLYVADAGNNIIRKISPLGVVTTFAGSGFKESADGIGILASFDFPDAIGIDEAGDLYVTDAESHYVRKIDKNNKVTALPYEGLAFGNAFPSIGTSGGISTNGIVSNSQGTLIYVANADDEAVELYGSPPNNVTY